MPDPLDPAAVLARVPEGYTPGPWHLSADRESITQTSHLTRDVWTIPRTHEDMALIALAPDLVAALRVAVERCAAAERERDEACYELAAVAVDDGVSPWSLIAVLRRLADAADHLHHNHNCDAHGWEEARAAATAARQHAERLTASGGCALRALLAKAEEHGRQSERASVVAWLRQNAERVGQALAAHPNAGSVSRRNRSTRIHAYRELADAIERGEHAKEEG